MSARSRRKGARWERRMARLFTEHGIDAERCLTEVRDGRIGDLTLPPDVPLTVECRVGGAPSPWKALRDAREAAEGDGEASVPVGLLRRNGSGSRSPEDMAVLPIEQFVELVAELVRLRNADRPDGGAA